MTPAEVVPVLAAAAGGGFLLAALLTPVARRVALRVGYVDNPGGHKSHVAPIPYGGGVAIFLAGWLPLAAALLAAALLPQEWVAARFGEPVRAYVGGVVQRSGQAWVILAGAAALHVLGLFDDRRALGPWLKMGIMLGVAAAVAWLADLRIATLLGREVSLALTVVWMVVVINAFNFLDNMDGLSAGVAAIVLAFLAACGVGHGQVLVPLLACLFAGAIAGFLVFNFPPARLFMGDAGSLLIGYMVAVVSILTTYFESGGGAPPYALAMPLVVLAVPLYDFVSVVTIRLREGRSPLRGDQRHFSHRLVERGLSRRLAVLTIYLATAATGVAATLLPGATLRQTLSILGLVAMVLAIVAILESPVAASAEGRRGGGRREQG